MKIIIDKDIKINTLRHKKYFIIHKKGKIEFNGNILFITGSNGIGKSTFGEWIKEKYNYDYFNGESFDSKINDQYSGYNVFDRISDHMSSSGEKHFDRLYRFINKSNTEFIILDEPEKSLSINSQIGILHLFKDKLLEGKKFIIITHSYLFIYFAEQNNIPIYDFDKKKIVNNFLPKL